MIDLFGHAVSLDYRLAIVIASVCVGGFIRGFTGFGSALAIIPSLVMIFTPREAVAMHALMEIPVLLSMAFRAAKNANRSVVAPMIAGLAVATPLGAYVLTLVPAEPMKVTIALVVLAMVGLLYVRRDLRFNLTGLLSAITGLVGGIFQGATGIGGPPVVTALLSRGDPSPNTRANIFTVMSALIAMCIVSFGFLGLFTPTVLIFGALGGPFCLASTWLGAHWFGRGGESHFDRAVLILLALLSLMTLASVVFS